MATQSSGTTGVNLRLRSGPSMSASTLTVMPAGSQMIVTGPSQNGWYPVIYNGQTGWAGAQYVTVQQPSGSSTTSTGTTSTPGANLNLRSGGGLEHSIIGKIPHGSQITITGASVNGWYPVSYNGQTGWVSAQYVNAPNAPTGTTPAPSTSPAPPPSIPHTQNDPNTPSGSNPYYEPDSTYGGSQNWWDTPLVQQSVSPQARYEKWLTEQGYGGNRRHDTIARGLYERASAGFGAATANNPNLDFGDYLDTLGTGFIKEELAGMTADQKGEQYGRFAPRNRWTLR